MFSISRTFFRRLSHVHPSRIGKLSLNLLGTISYIYSPQHGSRSPPLYVLVAAVVADLETSMWDRRRFFHCRLAGRAAPAMISATTTTGYTLGWCCCSWENDTHLPSTLRHIRSYSDTRDSSQLLARAGWLRNGATLLWHSWTDVRTTGKTWRKIFFALLNVWFIFLRYLDGQTRRRPVDGGFCVTLLLGWYLSWHVRGKWHRPQFYTNKKYGTGWWKGSVGGCRRTRYACCGNYYVLGAIMLAFLWPAPDQK